MNERQVRLTETVKAAGCASKISPAILDQILGRLPKQHDPNVLVGFDKADDAGIYQLSPELAMVQTVDFFTPIVDDPYTFGQIAATNALSDVYAMGGRPVSALALVCFPERADTAILERILAGGLSKMVEAGCTVVGGHSVRDDETKFGYAVTGLIHPRKVFRNSEARPGDVLLFTKALGTGVISTAIKQGKAKQSWIDPAVKSATTLNKAAAEAIVAGQFEVHGMTDVTGFGMIGHAREMALGARVTLQIEASKVPVLPGALDCIRQGFLPGGLKNNRDFAECLVTYRDSVPEELRTLLFDPQTAGGLLIAVGESDAGRLTKALRQQRVPAATIGCVLPAVKPGIEVI